LLGLGAAIFVDGGPRLTTAIPKLTKGQIAIHEEALRQEVACRRLAYFVRFCWDAVEATPLVWGDHLDLMCQELMWLAEGRARCLECWDVTTEDRSGIMEYWGGNPDPDCPRCEGCGFVDVEELVLCVPPGHAKSLLASVFFPAWLWLEDPGLYLLTLANDNDLAGRDSKRMRDLILREPYKQLQRRQAVRSGQARADASGALIDVETGEAYNPWSLSSDQATKVNFTNTAKGGRNARGILTKILGKRCRGLIVDDPHDLKDVVKGKPAKVVERMREVRKMYFSLESRLNVGAWKLVIMQRLHTADLVGELIKEGDEATRVICLPVRYDPRHPQAHPGDNREPDEWLCEAAFAEGDEERKRGRLTPKHYVAQYEQRPSSDVGGMFKREWFQQRYAGDPMLFAAKARFSWVEISADCTFDDTPGADYVLIQVWGKATRPVGARGGIAPGRYLLDEVRGRMDIIATCQALKDLGGKWPQTKRVTVETKANGPAVIKLLKADGHEKVVGFNPDKYGSKEARANVASVSYQAGDVWYPEAEFAPWVGDHIEEIVSFPAGANDDRVDAMSALFILWDEEGGGGEVNAGLEWADLL
jgi:predicted phage terminase large subunit-like protein